MSIVLLLRVARVALCVIVGNPASQVTAVAIPQRAPDGPCRTLSFTNRGADGWTIAAAHGQPWIDSTAFLRA